jgi:hypothetical protein
VALIRTDVSEDRIACIFRVYECEQAQSEVVSSCIVLIRATRRYLPEDDNHHSHRRGNLKSYKTVQLYSISRRSLVKVRLTLCYIMVMQFILSAVELATLFCCAVRGCLILALYLCRMQSSAAVSWYLDS